MTRRPVSGRGDSLLLQEESRSYNDSQPATEPVMGRGGMDSAHLKERNDLGEFEPDGFALFDRVLLPVHSCKTPRIGEQERSTKGAGACSSCGHPEPIPILALYHQ